MVTSDIDTKPQKDTLNPVVFFTSAGLILAFCLMTIFYTDLSNRWIGITLNWVSATFGWYYLLAATLYIVLLFILPLHAMAQSNLAPSSQSPSSAWSVGRQCCSPPVSVLT